MLYAEKLGIPFEEAKSFVVNEYLKVGEGSIEWYDIKYWFQSFQLEQSWNRVMKQYADKINIYPDVHSVLERLKDRFRLVLTSNAGREFIDVEMEVTGLGRYFDRIFSATSDFREVKKTKGFYQRICKIVGTRPQEIVHVGDHYEFDYVVPRSLGIHAFYLDRSKEKKGEFIIPDLRDLEKKLPEEVEQAEKNGISP
jgi:putative hydrolase of the HAD superfamily